MNMFKTTSAKTVQEYLNSIDDTRKQDMHVLHKFIQKTVPTLKPFLLAGMIGYGKYRYKTKAGREGDWALVALAAQKNYISLYACAADDTGYVAEKYKTVLPKASIGKSCIRFKKLADVDILVLEKILRDCQRLGGVGAM